MSGLIGPLKWTSSNTNVATVNSSGKVSAKKSGNTTVTVSVGNLSASCNVTVKRENTAASYEEKYKNYLAKMDSSYSFAIVNSAEGYIFAAKNPDACVGDESRINKVKRIFFFTAPKKEGFFSCENLSF